MTAHSLQEALLEAIRGQLPAGASLADELAECLYLSKDSAYRRIRGDTLFDIGEIDKLTSRYHLPLNSLFGVGNQAVSFVTQRINLTDFTFQQYLQSVLDNLIRIQTLPRRHLYYSARDIPIFHYFQLPALCTFKLYFWMRYYLHHPGLQQAGFDPDNLPAVLHCPGQIPERIWHAYMKTPSTEVWTYETANITLRQIEFAYHTGVISLDLCRQLLKEYKRLLAHIRKQARQGNKFYFESDATLEGAEYNLYFNEVAIGDNSILFDMEDRKMAFITYGNLNYMSTSDKNYTDYLYGFFRTSMENATLISTTAQKVRGEFFSSLNKKIDQINRGLSAQLPPY